MKKTILILVVLLLVITGFYYVSLHGTSKTGNPTVPNDFTPEVGIITQKSDGTSLYTSNKYKLSFSFPTTWRLGDNRIDYGTFQIMSYSLEEENKMSSEVFPKGASKIEMVLLDKEMLHEDEALVGVTMGTTTIAGQPATFYKNESIITNYKIQVPSHPEKYLSIAFYGDEVNYSVFEKLIKGLTWNK